MLVRYLLALLLSLSMLTFVGCDSDDDDDPFQGVWEAIPEDVDGEVSQSFLVIDDDLLTVYFFFGDVPGLDPCYQREPAELVSRDGDTWTVRDADGDEVSATVRLSGDRLTITSEGDTVRFDRSDRSVSSFDPECLF